MLVKDAIGHQILDMAYFVIIIITAIMEYEIKNKPAHTRDQRAWL